MLNNTWLVTEQVLILFLLIAVGYIASRIRMLNEDGTRQLTNLLLVIITPAVIIRSFQTPFDVNLVQGLAIALISAVVSHASGAVVTRLIFRHQIESRRKVLEFSVIFSNSAFMSFPLLDAILGSQGVLFGSVYVAVFNIVQWTYGVRLMTGEKKAINWRQTFINPGTVPLFLAFPLFILQIRLPEIPTEVIRYLSALMSPIAMIIIGAQLSLIHPGSIFTDKSVLLSALLRLLIVPALIVVALVVLPLPLDRTLFLACVIPAAAPTAAGATLFATRYNQDTLLATRTVALSTLLSVLTIPFMILLAEWLGGY